MSRHGVMAPRVSAKPATYLPIACAMVQRTTRRTCPLPGMGRNASQSEGFLQDHGPLRKRDHAQIALALFQPDIAPNVGAVLRLGACLGVPVHVIEPCGFPFSPRAWRRQAMDYADLAELHRHDSWAAFTDSRPSGRLVALTTKGANSLWDFRFRPGDTLLFGRESAGLPDEVHAAADARVVIPMQAGARSLNIAMAAAIAAAEAGRQLGIWSKAPGEDDPVGIDPTTVVGHPPTV